LLAAAPAGAVIMHLQLLLQATIAEQATDGLKHAACCVDYIRKQQQLVMWAATQTAANMPGGTHIFVFKLSSLVSCCAFEQQTKRTLLNNHLCKQPCKT
jgi:hypothetical protein